MISSFDYYKQIENPDMYLCNPDKRFLCALDGENRHLILRFNDLSELTFTVPKMIEKENEYNLVEAKRLIFVDKIGWFQIVAASETIEGDNCVKSVTAQSLQCTFKNRGFVTEERIYMFYNPNDALDSEYQSGNPLAIPSVVGQLNKQLGIRVALQKDDVNQYDEMEDWTIIYIDPSLQFHSKSYGEMYTPHPAYENICRGFEANGELNGYDFIINQVENAFNVIFEFDYLKHTIKVKTLENITKPTDIYLSFDNIINSLNISENAENIVTIMSCNGKDIDIRTVNPMGTNYIANFDYYKKAKSDNGKVEYPWMSKELIAVLDNWEKEFEKWQKDDENRLDHTKSYSNLVKQLQEHFVQESELKEKIQFANLKLTDLQVARDQFLSSQNGDKDNNKDKDDKFDGKGYITAEEVEVQQNSLLPISTFHSNAFSEDVSIIGHIVAPTPMQDENGRYKFAFSDEGIIGTPESLIENFIDTSTENDKDIQNNTPLFFMDGDNRSYCKLVVSSDIAVIKNQNGDISASGSATIKDIEMQVEYKNKFYTIKFPDGSTITATKSNSYFTYNGNRFRILQSADNKVTIHCFYVSSFERYTTYAEMVGDNGWCSIWENHIIQNLNPALEALNEKISLLKNEMQFINEQCNLEKFVKSYGDKLYKELSNYWVEGDYTNDNIAAFNTTTMTERIDFANDLMSAAKIDLAKCAQPQFEMSVDAINFIKMYEFKNFTQQLALGRVITIEKSADILYYPALMSIDYDLDTTDNFTMTFSNASKPNETAMTFADLIKQSSSTTRTISANWSNLMDYSHNKEEIIRLIEAPLDRSLRAMQANMAAQAFVVDDKGILGRKYNLEFDGSKGTFLPEQIRIINNTIMFTQDNWQTAALALGNTDFGYGLVANVLVGELIVGEQISIGSQSERVRIDNNGLLIKNDNGDVVLNADENGNLVLQGKITATEGQIGGYAIGETALTGASVGMSSDNTENAIAFWAGASEEDKRQSPFYITKNGELYTTNAYIEGVITLISDMPSTINNLNGENFCSKNLQVAENFQAGNLIVQNSMISCASNDTYINFTTGVVTEMVVATVEICPPEIHQPQAFKITLNKPLTVAKTFVIHLVYLNLISPQRSSCSVTINANQTEFIYNTELTLFQQLYMVGFSSETVTNTKDSVEFPQPSASAKGTIEIKGNLLPESDKKNYLGSENLQWKEIYSELMHTAKFFANRIDCDEIYSQDGTIQRSDFNVKHTISDINEIYSKLFDKLRPVTYKFNNGTSGRIHMGLIAQELKQSLDEIRISSNDFATYCEWKDKDDNLTCGIRYVELIALCIYEVQKLKNQIKSLASQVNGLS